MVEIERQKASLVAEIDRARAAFRSATTELNASLDVTNIGKTFVAKHSWLIIGSAVGTGIIAALVGTRAKPFSKLGSSVVSGTAGVAKAGIKALVLNSLLSAVQPIISRVVIDKLTKTLSEKSPELLKIFTALTKK